MNRILPLLSLPLLSLAAAFAANTPEHIGNDLKLFKDSSCTSLKPDVKDTSAFQSDAMKELAPKSGGPLQAGLPVCRIPALLTAPDGEKSQNRRRIQQMRQHDGRLSGKGRHVVLVGKTEGREISLLLPNLMRKPAPKECSPQKTPMAGIAQKADSAQGRNQHH
ncbi:MAG: hypothetical protein ACLT38_04935 [Akkermansia sp.]